MAVSGITSSVDIAVSGMRAQSKRLDVISGNIANAGTTRTDSGEPYRRQVAVLTAGKGIAGVAVETIDPDMDSDFQRVHQPGHPDADGDGWVQMPNVSLPNEMMNMVVASRAYQANAAVLRRYKEAVDTALEMLR